MFMHKRERGKLAENFIRNDANNIRIVIYTWFHNANVFSARSRKGTFGIRHSARLLIKQLVQRRKAICLHVMLHNKF